MHLSGRFIPILLSAAVLAGAGADMMSRPGRRDAEPFHRRVYAASKKIPMRIGDWIGQDHEVARGAQKLLRPNVMIQRQYVNEKLKLQVGFLLVQCKDARDMDGHFPPVCYPGSGWELKEAKDSKWQIAAPGEPRSLDVREYHFIASRSAMVEEIYVAHLIVMPSGSILQDTKVIGAAQADRAKRFFGAAQIQFVFNGAYSEEQRRAVFSELMGAREMVEMLDALRSGGNQ